MDIKAAAIRGVRTFCQSLAGLLLSVPVFATLLDVSVAVRQQLGVALANAALIGVISFLQNVAEDNTDIDVPKG